VCSSDLAWTVKGSSEIAFKETAPQADIS
jgi:hypothetical protein